MKNVEADRYLLIEGPSLTWVSAATPAFNFSHQQPANLPPLMVLRYQVAAAIRNQTGQYLRATRSGNMPVEWSDAPAYEWTFGGGPTGVPVRDPASLHNAVRQDTLTYCPDNPAGRINLRWARDCHPPTAAGEQPVQVAHPEVQWRILSTPAEATRSWAVRVVHANRNAGLQLAPHADQRLIWWDARYGAWLLFKARSESPALDYLRYNLQLAIMWPTTPQSPQSRYLTSQGWSGTASFEWLLVPDKPHGSRVSSDHRLAILNMRKRDFIVYCGGQTEMGLNLTWLSVARAQGCQP